MDSLDGTAEDKLDPEVPVPVEIGLEEAADDGADDGATDGREDDEGNGVLLVIGIPHVSDCMYAHITW